MKRREFIKKAGIVLGGIPFWTGIMSEDAAAKLPADIKITDVKSWAVGIEVRRAAGLPVFRPGLPSRHTVAGR